MMLGGKYSISCLQALQMLLVACFSTWGPIKLKLVLIREIHVQSSHIFIISYTPWHSLVSPGHHVLVCKQQLKEWGFLSPSVTTTNMTESSYWA